MTKKSNSVLAGRPWTRTRIFSTGPRDSTSTSADACGRQPAFVAAADRTILKSISFSCCRAWADPDTTTTDTSTAIAAAAPSAFHHLRARCMTHTPVRPEMTGGCVRAVPSARPLDAQVHRCIPGRVRERTGRHDLHVLGAPSCCVVWSDLAKAAGRIAGRDGAGGYVAGDDGSGCDDRSVADRHSGAD